MARRHKHLSRAHRAAIAAAARLRHIQHVELRELVEEAIRGKRWIRGAPGSKYRGQFVSHAYARRYPHLVVIEEGTEEWEITVHYKKGRKGQDIGITMRVTAPKGTPREVILVVARRAAIDRVEEGFQVHTINWQKGLKEYDYGADVETGLQVPGFTGLLQAGTVRAERVAE